MKNAKMPVQGKGVIRDVNRSQIEGGVEASGIFGTIWDGIKKYGPGALNAVNNMVNS